MFHVLAVFPAKVQLYDGLHSCLDLLVRLPRQSGLLLSSEIGYELDSLLGQGSRMGPKASMACCLGDPNQAALCTISGLMESPALFYRWVEPLAMFCVHVPLINRAIGWAS